MEQVQCYGKIMKWCAIPSMEMYPIEMMDILDMKRHNPQLPDFDQDDTDYPALLLKNDDGLHTYVRVPKEYLQDLDNGSVFNLIVDGVEYIIHIKQWNFKSVFRRMTA